MVMCCELQEYLVKWDLQESQGREVYLVNQDHQEAEGYQERTAVLVLMERKEILEWMYAVDYIMGYTVTVVAAAVG